MTIVLSFLFSLFACLLLKSSYSPLKILDLPNERSLHVVPTPRTGGVGVILATLIVWGGQCSLYGMPYTIGWISVAALLVASISLIDDFRELSPLIRILVHGVSAGVLIVGGLVIFEGWFGILFTWFAIVWMLNLYNFMDGMDGFAGGMTLSGFAFLTAAGWLQGANEYAMFTSIVAAAAFGFLFVNFPPARIFMGDVGSATLGLLAAAFSLWGIRDGIFEWWFPALIFSPFIVDATVTLLRRIMSRERIWEAHRSHYYQRLVQMGWGHKKTVIAEYLLMLLVGFSALSLLFLQNNTLTYLTLLTWCSCYLLVIAWIHRQESKLQ